jgi:hypothetical protein
VVDVSSVRNILSQIRRVVTGDVILPEDHNLQTDALTALTDVVEAIPEPPPPPTPPPPQALVLAGGDAVNSLCWVGAGNIIGYFKLPFDVKLKKFILYIKVNNRDGSAVVTVRHERETDVGSVTVPPNAAGEYSADLGDYLLPAHGALFVVLDSLGGTFGDIFQWFYVIHAERST